MQNILLNIRWLFFDKVFRSLFHFFLTVYVARHYGADDFGIFSFGIAFLALSSPIATLGLEQIVIRILVKQQDQQSEILTSALYARLMGALCVFILAFCILYYLRQDDEAVMMITSILLVCLFFQITDVFDFYFQSIVASKNTVLSKNFAFAMAAVFKLLCIYLELPIVYIAWGNLVEAALLAFFLLVYFSKIKVPVSIIQPSARAIKALLKESFPLMWAGALVIVYMRIDQTMLAEMVNDKAVGIYAASVQLSEQWYFIPAIVSASVFPMIFRAFHSNRQLYYKRLQLIYNIFFLVSLAASIIVSLFSKEIISIIYGDEYMLAGEVLSVHIWASVFVFWGHAATRQLVAENLTMLILFRTLAGAIANILLNLLLIPEMAELGAAWATLVSYAISDYFMLLFFKRGRPLFIMLSKSIYIPSSILSIPELYRLIKDRELDDQH